MSVILSCNSVETVNYLDKCVEKIGYKYHKKLHYRIEYSTDERNNKIIIKSNELNPNNVDGRLILLELYNNLKKKNIFYYEYKITNLENENIISFDKFQMEHISKGLEVIEEYININKSSEVNELDKYSTDLISMEDLLKLKPIFNAVEGKPKLNDFLCLEEDFEEYFKYFYTLNGEVNVSFTLKKGSPSKIIGIKFD